MRFKFCFQVLGKFNTKDLWSKVQSKGITFMDLGDVVFIYGETGISQLNEIIKFCCAIGGLNGSISEGR